MTLGERIDRRREALGISQAELARRVGVRQSTMNSLIRGESRSSRSIVAIARELGTTPAYLSGQTDDPTANVPPAPALTPPPVIQHILMPVAMPEERALTRMFEALLRAMPPGAGLDEQAELLAKRLPIGLAQLRDLLPATLAQRPRRKRLTNPLPFLISHRRHDGAHDFTWAAPLRAGRRGPENRFSH